MRLKELFKAVFQGKRLMPPKEPGPIEGAPGLQDCDIGFILKEHAARKWGDVEYYGPGADEANRRRARALGIESLEEPKKERPRPRKRKVVDRLAALIRKRDKLKEEVEKFEN